ncbi:MAG TPA: hypothetical protein PLS86_08950, partial [Phycisphaerae bacterium]|nr:hypothetical protein [Phycisphaerae bacterium]HQA44264.1 hypothetical protein [Phycisphaerae bacterium]
MDSDEKRLPGDALKEIELTPALVTLMREVAAVRPDGVLTCGDLLCACLLDPGTTEVVSGWIEQRIDARAALLWVRDRESTFVEERVVRAWKCEDAQFRLTTWASFVLRFVNTCGSGPDQIFTLMSGLLEVDAPSVSSLLTHLGLSGHALSTALTVRGFHMVPLLDSKDDPCRQEAESSFISWLVDSGCFSEWLSAGRQRDLGMRLMVEWLEGNYLETACVIEAPQLGDIALFS